MGIERIFTQLTDDGVACGREVLLADVAAVCEGKKAVMTTRL